ncbi:MAG: TonB-dependent siderophore receptor [Aquabacterium sp.]|uniref:TonB-dependent siderophore receptor n=1 Tax=Aquabacterium sp. TaxID=1872578 RepID=UPI003BD59E5C
MHRPSLPRRSLRAPYLLTPLAVAALSLSLPVAAQEVGDTTLPSIGVTATAKRQQKASISGLGDAPSWQQPVQALTFSQDALRDAQVTRLADLTKLDASTSDAYNTVGYWDYLTVRGFALDNAYNYRREGLPISAETRIALDNKAGIELFKGTSGIQAGVSSPGGLVNYLVKRPESRVRTATLSIDDAGDVSTSVDLGDRFGERKEWGLRVNAAIEKLKSHIDATDGHRRLAAVAMDHVLAPGHVLEAEVEHSYASQPSIPGFSMLGDTLPSAKDIDPGVNLNHQPWTQPSQFRGTTGTIRIKSDLGQGWRSSVTYGAQYLKSHDRAAFPSGCDSEGIYDRYCSDGTFDIYDFRSNNESRTTRSLQAQVEGSVTTGAVKHDMGASFLRSVFNSDLHMASFNYPPVGQGNVSGSFPALPQDPYPGYPNTDRHERSSELSLRDALQFGDWRAWIGLRHSQIRRQAIREDNSFATGVIHKAVNTPWAAIGYNVAPQTQAYVSWGEGVEIKYAPRNTANAGAPMPLLKSRQTELGVKGQVNTPHSTQQWSVNVFHIARPEGATNADDVYLIDGQSKHIGIEGSWQGRAGAWGWGSSAMVLDAKRENSQFAANKSPVNVPDQLLKVSGSYTFKHPTPVTLQADLIHEGRRWVDVANTTRIPAWNRLDLSLRATQTLDTRTVTWRLAVNNVLDTRAWREAPNSFDHIYLFPMAERTIAASAQIEF